MLRPKTLHPSLFTRTKTSQICSRSRKHKIINCWFYKDNIVRLESSGEGEEWGETVTRSAPGVGIHPAKKIIGPGEGRRDAGFWATGNRYIIIALASFERTTDCLVESCYSRKLFFAFLFCFRGICCGGVKLIAGIIRLISFWLGSNLMEVETVLLNSGLRAIKRNLFFFLSSGNVQEEWKHVGSCSIKAATWATA